MATVLHVRVGVRDTLVAVFDGVESVGALGAATIVVKLIAAVQPLVPPAFVALARQ